MFHATWKQAGLFLVILVLSAPLCMADDMPLWNLSTGTIAEEGFNENISLRSESISIVLFTDYYTVDVTMYLSNSGPGASVTVGFPLFSSSPAADMKPREFVDFHTYVNDEAVPFEKKQLADFTSSGLNLFYVKQVAFKAGETTTTRVVYKAFYSDLGMWNSTAAYLYGTGSSWGKMPWLIDLSIMNKSNLIIRVSLEDGGKSYRISEHLIDPNILFSNDQDILHFQLFNVLPNSVSAKILISGTPLENQIDGIPHITYPPRPVLLKGFESYLTFLTTEQLKLLRNAMYALHGYPFKDPGLLAYFGKFDWYKPESSFQESMLSAEERAFTQEIRTEESKRR